MITLHNNDQAPSTQEIAKNEGSHTKIGSLNQLPKEILGIILNLCKFPELNTISLCNNKTYSAFTNNETFLCKRLEQLLYKFPRLLDNEEYILQRKLICQSFQKKEREDLTSTTQWYIKKFFTNLFMEIFPFDTCKKSFIDELIDLIVNIKIENIHVLTEIRKARDDIIFWNYLKNELKKNFFIHTFGEIINIDAINSVKELLALAKGLPKWCDFHKNKLASVKVLHLENKRLTTVPSEIGYLINLEKLNLSFNQITSLPPGFKELKQLQLLYLNDNLLNTVPPEITHLDNLHTLVLKHNRITSIPPAIGRLKQLRCFYLNDNLIDSLPAEIWKLNKLEIFDLNTNRLISISPKIGKLTKLRTLTLHNNPLVSMPKILKSIHLRIYPILEPIKIKDPDLWSDEKDDQ